MPKSNFILLLITGISHSREQALHEFTSILSISQHECRHSHHARDPLCTDRVVAILQWRAQSEGGEDSHDRMKKPATWARQVAAMTHP